MRHRSLGLLLGLLILIAAGKPATADDDPVFNGVKLSEVITMFKAANSDDEKSVNERSRLAQAIAMFDSPKALAFLGTVLREDKSRLVKLNTTYALNSLGPKAKPVISDLVAALKDWEPSVRAAAATTLGVIGPDAKAAAPELLSFLKNAAQAAEVRVASAAALASIVAEAKDVVPALKDAIKDKDAHLRMSCASSLYKYDKANAKLAVPVLREALKDKNTKMEAVLRLKTFGSDAKEAIPDLIALLKEGGVGGYYAPETLGAIPEAEAALLTALKSPDKELQQAAASALRKAFPESAKKAGLIK